MRICDPMIKYPIYDTVPGWQERVARLFQAWPAWCCVCGNFSLVCKIKGNLRETCFCMRCLSTNRNRQLAFVVCHTIGHLFNRRILSLKELPTSADFVIYNTETQGPIHEKLIRNKNYIFSGYFGPQYKSGHLVNNIMHQDLMELSLASESVDLVLSGDVFEHIPKPYRAHQEIYRILKKGGRHIFTVPFLQTEYLDKDMVTISDDGELIFKSEPIYHSDPLRLSEGALVYKIFSMEMLIKLSEIGFVVNLFHLNSPWRGIFDNNALVFESFKPL